MTDSWLVYVPSREELDAMKAALEAEENKAQEIEKEALLKTNTAAG